MLFREPVIGDREKEVLAEIAALKDGPLQQYTVHQPGRWTGSLRRMTFARNIQGSNTIEGFTAVLDDAAAVALGEPPLDASVETRWALGSYRLAMTYILQVAHDPGFVYSEDVLKSLHFMMTSYDLKNHPGRWRPGQVFVQRSHDGEIVYEGAPASDVPALMRELVQALNHETATDPIISAAMAHLNLVMVHPFKDGNGRMGRALQSLVLARSGTLSPIFMSIEEYLGRNTEAYYNALAVTGAGAWNPARDTTTWIRFNLTAHVHQANTQVRRIREAEQLWAALEKILNTARLPERCITALFDAAMGWRIRNSTYRAALAEQDEQISEQSASVDLKRLVELDLLEPVGEKRGRHYVAAGRIRELRTEVRSKNPLILVDPFAD